MSIARRDFLKLATLVSAGATVSACTPAYRYAAGGPLETAPFATMAASPLFPALSRLTYGPRLEDVAQAERIGLGGWIEEQLAHAAINDFSASLRTRKLSRLTLDADALDGNEPAEVISDLKAATLLRQIYSKRQLYERMAEFWSDHFNISVNKGFGWALKVVDDREVIRPHALGNFRELLGASARSAAMLFYLDNQANVKDHPNENYARELMELHTLGVDGGYTQGDVMELARCLTGWTIKEHFWRGQFTFKEDTHDTGSKQLLGITIPPGGADEVETVLDHLASHPSTARFIATKLVRRFITDDPLTDAPALVERAAQAFLQHDGDIPAVLRVVLLDGLALRRTPLPLKFKRPVEFVVSALRALDAETDGSEELWSRLSLMGQPTFEWPTPDGPPDVSAAWHSNLMPRWSFAYDLGRGHFERTTLKLDAFVDSLPAVDPVTLIDQFSLRLLGQPYPKAAKETFVRSISAGWDDEQLSRVTIAGLLAAPAFQYH